MQRKIPVDFFRQIGFNTEMRPSGCKEKIFFIQPLSDIRMQNVSMEAVEEFIEYWQHQINTAKAYVQNGLNNKTHE